MHPFRSAPARARLPVQSRLAGVEPVLLRRQAVRAGADCRRTKTAGARSLRLAGHRGESGYAPGAPTAALAPRAFVVLLGQSLSVPVQRAR